MNAITSKKNTQDNVTLIIEELKVEKLKEQNVKVTPEPQPPAPVFVDNQNNFSAKKKPIEQAPAAQPKDEEKPEKINEPENNKNQDTNEANTNSNQNITSQGLYF